MGYTRNAIFGLSWMGTLQVFIRVIALLKFIILARILSPPDFGLFGIVILIVGLLETITNLGIPLFFIQSREELKKYIDTAWVVNIVRGLVLSIVIFSVVPFVASFFADTRLKSLLYLASIIPLVKGFANPMVAKFQKDLAFEKEFFLKIIPLVGDITISIVSAIIFRSPIALILGVLTASFLETVYSFFSVSPRPTLRFESNRFREIIHFSRWITLYSISTYLMNQLDSFAVGRYLGTTSLGIYQMAQKFSLVPMSEFSDVVFKVIFPIYIKIYKDKTRVKRAFLKTLVVIGSVGIITTVVLYFFRVQLIRFSVGEKWIEASTIIPIFAILGLFQGLLAPMGALFLANGRQDLIAKLATIRLILLVFFIIPAVKGYGITGVAFVSLSTFLVIYPLACFWQTWSLSRKKIELEIKPEC